VRTHFGAFVLDSETRQLTRDGAAIHLSPKAFAVLCALVAKRPNVVPKADIFSQIWPDVFVVDGNLNVLVGEIRRALDDDPQDPRFIRTVHGVGYAFCGRVTEPDRPAAADGGPVRFWLAWGSRTFALSFGENVIGRDPRCDIWLDHSGVSRRHAQIHVAKGEARPMLTDLESTNGTFLKGKKVESPAPLADGDVIKVGSVNVKFREWTEGASRTKRIRGADRK
jgi:DNA-binding winged helix-turn-helix (wHTH) protein